MREFDAVVIGCGLCGSVIARQLAEAGHRVLILEKRNHIAGNLHDYREPNGFLVQKYGPHTFHTNEQALFDYVSRFEEWEPFILRCGAIINGIETPSPFNFKTIDQFYEREAATRLKQKLRSLFPNQDTEVVTKLLRHSDPDVREYAQFLFSHDYALYTAKQWGVSPNEIDPSVLNRVPIRFSYKEAYFDDAYQVMPKHSFTQFIQRVIDHPNISVQLKVDGLVHIAFEEKSVLFDGRPTTVAFTGPLDALFQYRYGELPYRSLRFEFKHADEKGIQRYPVTAYPQAKGFTRITDYRHLPEQDGFAETTYAVEYPLPFHPGEAREPYYPILTQESEALRGRYLSLASQYRNLFCCGRLADFKYYNMDQALARALSVSEKIIDYKGGAL